MMSKRKIYLGEYGFWVVDSLPYRGDDTVDVFPSYDHGLLECATRNLEVVRDNGTKDDDMMRNGEPFGSYESYYTSKIKALAATT